MLVLHLQPPHALAPPAGHVTTTDHVAIDVPADIQDSFAYYDANRSGFLDYLELQATANLRPPTSHL